MSAHTPPVVGCVPRATLPLISAAFDPYAAPGLFPVQPPIYQPPFYQAQPPIAFVQPPAPNPLATLPTRPSLLNGVRGGNPLSVIGPISNLIGGLAGNPQIGQITRAVTPLLSKFLGSGGGG